jgi:hypothetical protein
VPSYCTTYTDMTAARDSAEIITNVYISIIFPLRAKTRPDPIVPITTQRFPGVFLVFFFYVFGKDLFFSPKSSRG